MELLACICEKSYDGKSFPRKVRSEVASHKELTCMYVALQFVALSQRSGSVFFNKKIVPETPHQSARLGGFNSGKPQPRLANLPSLTVPTFENQRQENSVVLCSKLYTRN